MRPGHVSVIIAHALHLPETMTLRQLNASDTIALYLPEHYIYPLQSPCINKKAVVSLSHTSQRQVPCINKISVVPLPYT